MKSMEKMERLATDEINEWNFPKEVTWIDQVFGGRVDLIMPKYEDIPKEFKSSYGIWSKWQSEWFFSGLKRYPIPKEGIDLIKAIKHLGAIQFSFAPSHEHKAAGVAYLASLWFESPNGEELKKKEETEQSSRSRSKGNKKRHK